MSGSNAMAEMLKRRQASQIRQPPVSNKTTPVSNKTTPASNKTTPASNASCF